MDFWSFAEERLDWLEIGASCLGGFKKSSEREKLESKITGCFERLVDGIEAVNDSSKRSTKDDIKFCVKAAVAVVPVSDLLSSCIKFSPETVEVLEEVGKVADSAGPWIAGAKKFCANMKEFKDDDAVCRVVKAGIKTACQTGGAWAGKRIGTQYGPQIGTKIGTWIGTAVLPGVGSVAGAMIGATIGATMGPIIGEFIGEKIGGFVGDLITKPEETIKKVDDAVNNFVRKAEETIKKVDDAVNNFVRKAEETIKKVSGWFKSWW